MYPKTFLMATKTLLLAATVTTCWANSDILAQDNVLRTHPKLSRSLMTVAGANQEEFSSPPLSCSGEGFYSNEDDCTNFYRCINDASSNNYLRLAFKCPVGTIFSPEYTTCILGTCSPGQASAAASAAATASAEAAAGDDDVVLVSNIKPQGIHSISTSSKHRSPQCSSEGRFADPEDCGNFYDCVPGHYGGLVAHQQSCFGNAFDPALKACVPRHMVKGCDSYSTRSFPVADPKMQDFCNDVDNSFSCADCKSMIMCIGGKPYIQHCENGYVCSMKSSFSNGVCYPGDPVECTCNKADILRQDLYDTSKFLQCGNEGNDPIMHNCPEGLIFNEQCKACTKEKGSTCTASGKYVANDDCTGYYTFILNKGWIHEETTCKDKTMFNEETGKCEDPCDWYSGHFTCETEGRFANLADCTKYYECFKDPSNPNSLTLVERECPEGLEWSQTENKDGGYCVTSVTAKEKCVPTVKPDKCNIPDEWCTAAERDSLPYKGSENVMNRRGQ